MADVIRMSEATALGMHSMAAIARRDAPLSAAEVAAELRASETHVAKVLQDLARAGLLVSKRGPHGGYALAGAPDETSLLDVYEAFEGPLRADGCLFSAPVCRRTGCILGDLVRQLRSEAHDRLATTSLHAAVAGRR